MKEVMDKGLKLFETLTKFYFNVQKVTMSKVRTSSSLPIAEEVRWMIHVLPRYEDDIKDVNKYYCRNIGIQKIYDEKDLEHIIKRYFKDIRKVKKSRI